ncbi:MAG: hypothetical protein ACJAX5_003477 [Patiriisocius sp.]|jgi:hypothetical protein
MKITLESMKNFKIVALLLLTVSLSGPAYAENSWWEKAVNIFKSVETTKVLEAPVIAEISEAFKDPAIAEISEAFKQALRIGAASVVAKLGQVDGFNADAAIHIPLPEQLQKVKKLLAKVGMSHFVDELELQMNRAAEAATPRAKALFLESLNQMQFDDVMAIYQGPEDSATQYFKDKMSVSLGEEMRPIIAESLAKVGAIQAFDDVMNKYQSIPFVSEVKADLDEHVVQKSIDGIFYYMAKEEAEIRRDPLKQSTELLKKVFGVE